MSNNNQFFLDQAIHAFQSKNFERAKSILIKIIKGEPNNPIALQILGLIKAIENNLDEAIIFF